MHCNFKKTCFSLSVLMFSIILAGCHSQNNPHTSNSNTTNNNSNSNSSQTPPNDKLSLSDTALASSKSISTSIPIPSANISQINLERGFGQLKWNDSAALLKNAKESPAMEKEMLAVIGVTFNCYVSTPEENSFLQKTSDHNNINNKETHLYGYCFKGNHLALGIEMSADKDFYDTLYHWHQQHYAQMTNQTMIRVKSVNSQWLIKTHAQVLASMFYQSPEKHIAMWFVDNVPITLRNLSPKEIQKMQDDDEGDDSPGTPAS